MENDIEQIRRIIHAAAKQYQARGGDIRFVGIEGGIVKIAPGGFCWR
jgi:Fe-S cluster biogenesis protein NfuA